MVTVRDGDKKFYDTGSGDVKSVSSPVSSGSLRTCRRKLVRSSAVSPSFASFAFPRLSKRKMLTRQRVVSIYGGQTRTCPLIGVCCCLYAFVCRTSPVSHRLSQNSLSNRIFGTYDDIVDACCQAWNSLAAMPDRITSIATRSWAEQVMV